MRTAFPPPTSWNLSSSSPALLSLVSSRLRLVSALVLSQDILSTTTVPDFLSSLYFPCSLHSSSLLACKRCSLSSPPQAQPPLFSLSLHIYLLDERLGDAFLVRPPSSTSFYLPRLTSIYLIFPGNCI